MACFAMALFADDDYEDVAARLGGALGAWVCWGRFVGVPASGGITRELFSQVAVPSGAADARGVPGCGRLMAIDGFERDAPDSPGNAEAFGYAGAGKDRGAFPKVRVVTISECASHAVLDAEIGAIAGRAAASRPGGCIRGWRTTGC